MHPDLEVVDIQGLLKPLPTKRQRLMIVIIIIQEVQSRILLRFAD